jgi:hypothetical protein
MNAFKTSVMVWAKVDQTVPALITLGAI